MSVEQLLAMNFLTSDPGAATQDEVETGLWVLEEAFEMSMILGGTLVAMLAILVLLLSSCLFVTELRSIAMLLHV